jgi:ketosteroid isomerase-like protein
MQTNANAQRDLETLTALNRDFVASVQKGDVKRLEEILADDFMCSTPDGSLFDKAEYLKLTAQPVTISGLVAEDVRIRLLGDFAIIHGRFTAFSPNRAWPTCMRWQSRSFKFASPQQPIARTLGWSNKHGSGVPCVSS